MTFDEWWEVEGHLLYNKAKKGHRTWESVMNLTYMAGCESKDHQNLTSRSSRAADVSEHCKDCQEEFGHPDNCIDCPSEPPPA